MENYFKDYIRNFRSVLDSISTQEVAAIFKHFQKAVEQGNQIFVFGNGGSATNLTHFTTDMLKGATDTLEKPVKAISLNENMGLVTAIGNDYSFEDIFYKQLKVLANPGDLVLTLSVSGNSPNLVKAMKWAKNNNLNTIALVGGNNGRIASLVDSFISIKSLHYGHVEDLHMMICHMISFGFIEKLQFNSDNTIVGKK